MLRKGRKLASDLKGLFLNPGLFVSSGINAVRLSPRAYKEHFLVHTMAKVGSKTIVSSIEAAAPKAYLQITHTLAPASLQRAEQAVDQFGHWEQLDKSRAISRLVRQNDSGINWNVISPVRDPVARDISFFFESIPILHPSLVDCMEANRLIDVFLRCLSDDTLGNLVPHPVCWFDEEMLPTFGIDVFSKPFDFATGFSTYHCQNARLVVIRLEDFDKSLTEALSLLLSRPSIEIKNANRASQKKRKRVYDFYGEFRRNLVLPSAYIDRLYTSKFCTHFYRPDEIDEFRRQWKTK